MRRASPCLTALCLALLAGCGSPSGDASASSDDPAPAVTSPAAATAQPTSPAAADATTPSGTPRPRTGNELPAAGSQDFSAPAEAKGDDLPKVPASQGLTLLSGQDSTTSWSLTAKNEGKDGFCVSVKTKGVDDPDPLCRSGTQLALSFFTDQAEGHAIADVNAIGPSKTAAPTDIVVAGIAAPDVQSIVAAYAGKQYRGEITRHSVRLSVSKALAKQILDPTPEQLRSLPSKVVVRAFAITIPATKSAPPSTATPRTGTPVNGRFTFDLS